LECCKERGTAVNSAWYNEVLQDQLKPAGWTKWHILLFRSVSVLLHNSCWHTATHTIKCYHELNFEVLQNPLYGPDLSPSVTCFVHSWTLWEATI
jgi:hypothetical protein